MLPDFGRSCIYCSEAIVSYVLAGLELSRTISHFAVLWTGRQQGSRPVVCRTPAVVQNVRYVEISSFPFFRETSCREERDTQITVAFWRLAFDPPDRSAVPSRRLSVTNCIAPAC